MAFSYLGNLLEQPITNIWLQETLTPHEFWPDGT